MALLIFYLTDNNRHFTFPHFVNMLNKSKKKKLWKLLILTHTNDIDFYKKILETTDINSDYYNIDPNYNYLNKVKYAINYAENENFSYMMKCDNDIFLKSQTLDFIIDNLHLLNNNENLTLGPVLTSGIPGIEYFKEQFLDNETNLELNNLFLTTTFYDRDGVNYSILNKHSLEKTIWDKNEYFNSVKNLQHHYKGIHPIRINEQSLNFLNDYIVKNKDRFLMDYNLEIIENDNSPYLCNSIFAIRTDIYKTIVNDNHLYVDDFDEVPLNKYCWNNNMKHLFVKNGFAIHMYYNWRNNHIQDEKIFCNNFFENTEYY